MEANKLEAQRCVEIAEYAIKEKNFSKANKFLHKASKLDPSLNLKSLFMKVNSKSNDAETSKTGTEAGYGHYDQYEKESELRSRKGNFHQSRSQPSMQRDDEDATQNASTNGPTSKRARSRSAGRPTLGVHYTKEEADTVERIRHCKDYYEILNLKKGATEHEMKREYRKLALQLHPDKCRAPGATEAFKALGNAYAVLTNKGKREQYDLYGAEGPIRRTSSDDFYEYDYGRGFEAEFTPDEIFNMFFGGGYPSAHLHRRHGFRHTSQPQQNQPTFAPLLQLLPLFAVLILGLIAQLMVSPPPFSLELQGDYVHERFTKDLRIPYYVKKDFADSQRNRIRQIEQQVEDEFISQLRMNCYRERSQKETLLWRAQAFGDGDLLERARRMEMRSCDKLQKIYA